MPRLIIGQETTKNGCYPDQQTTVTFDEKNNDGNIKQKEENKLVTTFRRKSSHLPYCSITKELVDCHLRVRDDLQLQTQRQSS
jgi:hypothetical protein